MASVFEDFQDLINRGHKSNMTRDAKLIILGQILYAVTCNELTNQQAWKLEEMLGNRQDWED